MSRRDRQAAAEQAAAQASEAGRILQAQRQTSEPVESVDPAPEGERPSPRNEARRQAMEEIERRDLESKADEGLTTAPPPAAKPEPSPEPVPLTPEQILEANRVPEQTPEATPALTPTVATVKVKVDGEEFDVPQAEVDEAGGVAPYRMQRAAENRLTKASEIAAQTRQTQAALVNWIQQQQQPQQPPVSPQQFLASKIDVIRYGTPEESAAAFAEVLERANPRLDQNAITQQAVSTMHRQLAVSEFQKEFPEVVANPLVLKLALTLENERVQQIQQAGHTPNWPAFYRQIGNEVRSVIGKPSQPATTPTAPSTPSPVVDKEARKGTIVNLPTASARAELPKESKPETREDVLNQMRKTRGIPTG
jgi:hypothetical protein